MIRLAWLVAHGAVIENEGAAYARLAENLAAGRDYVSNLGGRNTLVPPLYPVAIALVASLTGSAELAARLISCVSGVLLIWPIYGIAWYLGERSSALIAAILTACAGVLVALSGSAYSEATDFLLLSCAMYFTCRLLDAGTLVHAVAAGVSFGLAYLVRPEAPAYAVLAVAFLIGQAILTRRPWRPVAARIGSLAGSAVLLAAPYVAWLSVNSGYLRWEGKSLINGIVSARMSAGESYQEAAVGLGPNLERLGPYLVEDQFRIPATSGTGLGLAVSTIFADTLPRLVDIVRQFASPSGPGGPLLPALAVVGLARSMLDRRCRIQKLFVLAAGATYVVILLSLQYYWDRFLFPLTLFSLPWAAVGIVALGDLVSGLAARSRRLAPRRRLVFAATAALTIALVSIPSFRYAAVAGDFTQSTDLELRSAGLWLRDRHATTTMGISGVVAYYAGATLVYLPWASEELTLRYVHERHPDFIVLRNGDEGQRPYSERWLSDGIPDPCAVPVQSFPQADGGRLQIWAWTC